MVTEYLATQATETIQFDPTLEWMGVKKKRSKRKKKDAVKFRVEDAFRAEVEQNKFEAGGKEEREQAVKDESEAKQKELEGVAYPITKQGKLGDKVFAETRLRRGVYGQRYDNGQRADGIAVRTLGFEDKPTKGPETLWDAPGMVRIKIPWGGVSPQQLDVLADLCEEYSDAILHVTTRQDIQLHYVHIEDTPDLMRRLAAVGITTREACGNSVRNVTACPLAGVCHTEGFDVSPYAQALMKFMLGHQID